MRVATYETFIETVADAEPAAAGQGGPRVIHGRIVRVRRRHAVAFVEAPVQEEPPVQEEVPIEPVERPPRTALLLATAHRMLEMIDGGEIDGHTGLARMLGVSCARVAQILDLTLLAPEIQDAILCAGRGNQRLPSVTPALYRAVEWSAQRALWRPLGAKP